MVIYDAVAFVKDLKRETVAGWIDWWPQARGDGRVWRAVGGVAAGPRGSPPFVQATARHDKIVMTGCCSPGRFVPVQ